MKNMTPENITRMIDAMSVDELRMRLIAYMLADQQKDEQPMAIEVRLSDTLGIVRLSGSQSFPIIRRICPRITSSTPPRTATFTVILAPSSPSTSPSSAPAGRPEERIRCQWKQK